MYKSTDFIGFTFNGQHSSNFNIYSVSDGSRYQSDLIPSPNDYSEKIPGGVGEVYFGTDLDSKEFPLSIAYDNLTERQIRAMRQWLAPEVVGELIFDEHPYKVYIAKVTNSPNLSFICFDETDAAAATTKRIYKGEGEINFICYNPLAKTPTGKQTLEKYSDYENVDEWKETSGLLSTDSELETYNTFGAIGDSQQGFKLYNPGDKETDFILSFEKDATPLSEINFYLDLTTTYFLLSARQKSSSIETDDKYGTISDDEDFVASTAGTIKVDTKKRTITFTYKGENNKDVTIPAYFLLKKGEFFKIPQTLDILSSGENNITNHYLYCQSSTTIPAMVTAKLHIEYDYLYY